MPKKKIENDIYELSKDFALRIVNLYKYLVNEKKENVLSKQLLRSGTGIGANVHEGKEAQSRVDFSSKMNIALKEARESEYWLELLIKADFLTAKEFESINSDCNRIVATLVKIVKATKDSK